MSKRLRSGFVQFPNAGKRDEFFRALSADDAVLTSRAYLSGNRPTIVFENLTAGEHKKVLSALQGLGRWFDDVQFEPMG